jgi:hypothetical protein
MPSTNLVETTYRCDICGTRTKRIGTLDALVSVQSDLFGNSLERTAGGGKSADTRTKVARRQIKQFAMLCLINFCAERTPVTKPEPEPVR